MKDLENVKLVFLPPNTPIKTQPMDQGVINNLKVHYRKRIVKKQIHAIDDKKDFSLTLLDTLFSFSTVMGMCNLYNNHNLFQTETRRDWTYKWRSYWQWWLRQTRHHSAHPARQNGRNWVIDRFLFRLMKKSQHLSGLQTYKISSRTF